MWNFSFDLKYTRRLTALQIVPPAFISILLKYIHLLNKKKISIAVKTNMCELFQTEWSHGMYLRKDGHMFFSSERTVTRYIARHIVLKSERSQTLTLCIAQKGQSHGI